MDAKTLQTMQSRDGLYILSDEVTGGATIAVMVYAGRMFRLACDVQLSADPKTWRKTTTLMGGPYSVQTCVALEDTIEGMKDELVFWKDLAQRSKDAVRFNRGFCPVGSKAVKELDDILARHRDYEEADAARKKQAAPQPAK